MSTTYSKTRALVEGALMVALATVLSKIVLLEMPFGGSVTLVSMLPLVMMSYRHGVKWGVFTAFVNSLIQLVLGASNLGYCPTLLSQIGCVFLDYVLAFTVLGLASFLSTPIKNMTACVAVGAFAVCVLRFACAVLSGALLWGSYQSYYDWAAGMNVWTYSLVYNGNYMLPETIITVVAAALLVKFAPKLFAKQS